MGFPAKHFTWTVSANNVITDATLAQMMGHWMKIQADFLLANGYTCKGSSDGVTAAMDGVNRWTTIAAASVRGANTTTAQSWMVLTDANGCNLCLAFCGAADSSARYSYSPSGVYVAAGTATFTPTATDELALTASAGQNAIGTTAAPAQRNGFCWVDSTSKACRFLVTLHSTNAPDGTAWGVEPFNTSLQDRTISPAVWGFAFAASAGTEFTWHSTSSGLSGGFAQGTRGGRTRVNGQAVNLNGGIVFFIALSAVSNSVWGNSQTDLQGGAGYPMWDPPRIGGNTSGWTGIAGQLYDWWSGRFANNAATTTAGDTYNNKNFMAVGSLGSIVWPWDGSTTPVTGVQASIAQSGNNTGFEAPEAPYYASLMNGVSVYAPLTNNAVTPVGPTAARSIARRPGVDVIRINDRTDDPPAETGKTLVYSRTIGGQQALFARYPDGTVYEVGAG